MIEEALMQLAAESPDREICGFLLLDGTIIPAPNIARGGREFEICHCKTVEVFENHADELRAVYHSHPSGIEYPSWADVKGTPAGLNCIIVTTTKVVEWIISDDGAKVERSTEMAGKVHPLAAVS